jgi:predicted DNA-binding transcriptional regulator YafY
MDKKIERVLNMYTRLLNGELLQKDKESARFKVNKRTIQRDMDDIRAYLANDMDYDRRLVYDRGQKGYTLIQNHNEITRDFEL